MLFQKKICRNLSINSDKIRHFAIKSNNLQRGEIMKNNSQNGFSLIELLLVVVIIGVLATLAVPSFLRSINVAENANALASLRTIAAAQVSYLSQNRRFARLNELNSANNDTFGTTMASSLIRGKFTFQMNPVNPTDAALSNNYTIVATKTITTTGNPYVISVDQSGSIVQILP